MATDDLYKRLQVDPQAETEVIRAAYHALARKYHPDAGGDLHRMVEFNAAWSVLGDPVLRAAYDSERNRPPAPPAPVDRSSPRGSNGRSLGENPLRTKRDASSTLDFGRYAGWSLVQVVEKDPDYLEWMVRTPIGRRLSAEVKELLQGRAATRSAVGLGQRERASTGKQWFGRARQGH
jgi:curved DNA-binding protein CbpA